MESIRQVTLKGSPDPSLDMGKFRRNLLTLPNEKTMEGAKHKTEGGLTWPGEMTPGFEKGADK